MTSIFRSKKNQNAVPDREVGKIAERIKQSFIQWQLRFAFRLQSYTERLSRKYKVIMLLLFVAIAILYSIRLATVSLSRSSQFYLSTGTIKKPEYMRQSGDENVRPSFIITKDEYKKIQKFRNYMDSLAQSPTGKKAYDKIIVTRPHLLDSIAIIENIYQSQTKN